MATDATAVPKAPDATALLNNNISKQNSVLNQLLSKPALSPLESGIQTASTALQGISAIGAMYTSLESLKIAKEQLSMQKKQFDESMKELNHTRAVRDRITRAF